MSASPHSRSGRTDGARASGEPIGADPARALVVVAGFAVLSLGWLMTAGPSAGALPWIGLVVLGLAVVAAPSLATPSPRVPSLAVALGVGGLLAVLGLVALLVGIAPLPLAIGAWVAAVLGVGTAAITRREPAVVLTPEPAARARPVTLVPEISRTLVPSTGPSARPERKAGVLETGMRLGRYKLEQRLAVGGMGEVWRAHHDTLIRPTVIKIVKQRPDEDPARERQHAERFRREAIITASLTSPHTVQLYDFGLEGDSSFYIAMELLEAMSLSQMVEAFGPMEEARVAFLLRQACNSLIEAHERGVVHRDIKPANLLLSRAGRDPDFLKVIDFGLVKDVRKPREGELPQDQLTSLGARPGTPGYMAPEQIGGEVIDHRIDLYALACVAYQMLTGRAVFEGTEEAQIMFAHMEVEPEPPSTRVGRPLHAGLEQVVMRCLAKDPSARPASMEALDDQLAALTFDAPWSQERARAWWTPERAKQRAAGVREEMKG